MRSHAFRPARLLRPTRTGPAVLFSVIALVMAVGGAQPAFATTTYRYRGWGSDDKSQLGISAAGQFNTQALAPSPDSTGWLHLAAGGYHTIALKDDGLNAGTGTVWAFGDNTYGQLGQGNVCNQANGQNCGGDTPVQVLTSAGHALTGVTEIAAGFYHNLARTSSGAVYAWGYNAYGQLGDNTTTDKSYATQVKNSAGTGTLVAAHVAGGFYHSLAIVGTGTSATAYGWGQNLYGQVGDGTITNRSLPVSSSPALTNVTKLAGGNSHTVALLGDGTSAAWGESNSGPNHGQLCDKDLTFSIGARSPKLITAETGLTDIGVGGGGFHTLLLKSNGQVRTCGANNNGQLGNNSLNDSSSPVSVKDSSSMGTLSNITAVAGCGFHSLALDTLGKVWAWGDGADGQLGNNTQTAPQKIPVGVMSNGSTLTGAAEITCGYTHSMALVP